jgi:hypothetical protein
MSIESLNVIANFEMLIFQFALIYEKGSGRGQSHASVVTSPAIPLLFRIVTLSRPPRKGGG